MTKETLYEIVLTVLINEKSWKFIHKLENDMEVWSDAPSLIEIDDDRVTFTTGEKTLAEVLEIERRVKEITGDVKHFYYKQMETNRQ